MSVLPKQVPSQIKRRIWDEYVQTPDGRQKLACALIGPTEDLALQLEADEWGPFEEAERLLRNGVKLMGRMMLDRQVIPDELLVNLQRLRDIVTTSNERWDALLEVEF